MPEWWTYSLSDFLMFSPRTYRRLVELYNAQAWPWPVVTTVSGVALLVLAGRGHARATCALLVPAWLVAGLAFHAQRFATIQWAATWFAAAFVLQALLLAAAAVARPLDAVPSRARRATGWTIASIGVVGLPLVAPITGRAWTTAETFALMPDPTAIATLGLLLALPARLAWLAPLPIAWCAISAATLWTMHAPEWWLPLAAACATVVAALPATAATSAPRPSPREPSRSRSRRAPRR